MKITAHDLAKLVPRFSVENAVAASTVEGATWEDIIAAALTAWPGLDIIRSREVDGQMQIAMLPLKKEGE